MQFVSHPFSIADMRSRSRGAFRPSFASHTLTGRRLGRGLDHFRKEGARLIPEPEPDPYIEEAYRLWAVKQQSK
jgi:hypothetical protein